MTKWANWKKHVSEWERSGQTQRTFCAKRDLAVSTFQWWRAKLRRAEPAVSGAPFLPLTLNAAMPGAGAAIEVELRSKTRLRLEGEAALRAVDRLVALIR